jgi:hypothetical protein
MIVVVEAISASGKSTWCTGTAARTSFRKTAGLTERLIVSLILKAQQRSGPNAT